MIVLFLKYPNKYCIFFGYFRTLTVYFQHNHDFKKTCLLLLLFGSVHLSMPGHDYVKFGRLAVTDKTKPIYIYLSIFTFVKLHVYTLFDY